MAQGELRGQRSDRLRGDRHRGGTYARNAGLDRERLIESPGLEHALLDENAAEMPRTVRTLNLERALQSGCVDQPRIQQDSSQTRSRLRPRRALLYPAAQRIAVGLLREFIHGAMVRAGAARSNRTAAAPGIRADPAAVTDENRPPIQRYGTGSGFQRMRDRGFAVSRCERTRNPASGGDPDGRPPICIANRLVTECPLSGCRDVVGIACGGSGRLEVPIKRTECGRMPRGQQETGEAGPSAAEAGDLALMSRALDAGSGIPGGTGTALQLASVLQTSLDVDKLIEIFSRHIQHLVPHGSIGFENRVLQISVTQGTAEKHVRSYQLVVAAQTLGVLTVTRRTRFTAAEGSCWSI